MIDILDEISEIPFQMFWEKYNEKKPGIYHRQKAEKEWFFMKEADRVTAFENLCKGHRSMSFFNEPYEYLIHHSMPF
jgi:hypothetical protein